MAFQLRYLQTLSAISTEKNSTILFPVPIDIMRTMGEFSADLMGHNLTGMWRASDKPPVAKTVAAKAMGGRGSAPSTTWVDGAHDEGDNLSDTV